MMAAAGGSAAVRGEPSRTYARCGVCGVVFDDAGWTALRIVQRLEANEVARWVTGWPVDHCVEVRACASCGRGISARRPATPESRE